MITQQHEHEIQQNDQAPVPVKEPLWRVALFTILGTALPLVFGWWMAWPPSSIVLDIFGQDLILLGVVMLVVPVAAGAFLLCFTFRVWWAAVFAGAAWFIGQILAAVVLPVVAAGWQEHFWTDELGIIILGSVPLLIGMTIGAVAALHMVGKRNVLRQ